MFEQKSTGKKNEPLHVYISEAKKKTSLKDLTVKLNSFIILFRGYPLGVSSKNQLVTTLIHQ
jgi:hypothetical protein